MSDLCASTSTHSRSFCHPAGRHAFFGACIWITFGALLLIRPVRRNADKTAAAAAGAAAGRMSRIYDSSQEPTSRKPARFFVTVGFCAIYCSPIGQLDGTVSTTGPFDETNHRATAPRQYLSIVRVRVSCLVPSLDLSSYDIGYPGVRGLPL